MNTVIIATLSIVCFVLALSHIVLYYHYRRRKAVASKHITQSPEQLLAEVMRRDQQLAAELKQSLDELSGLQWQIGTTNFKEQIDIGIRKVHQVADDVSPFALKTAGLFGALSGYVDRMETQHTALEVDLTSSEMARIDAAREWAMYHLLITLLRHSLSEAEDLHCYLSIHLGFQSDYLALRYQDETSPLPNLSQDNEVAATLRFWLHLLQLAPMVQSEHEWVFRVPIPPSGVPRRLMGVG